MQDKFQQLSSKEKARYNRHIILPEIGLEGQAKLKNASVLVIGAGGLGSPLLQYLGAAGIGKIGIVDFDKVDESNLHRQILFQVNDIGRYKAEVAKERLLANNPFLEIEVIKERIDASNALEIIKKYDLVADGSDNFATRYLINDACVILDKPLIFGAIFKFEGQLSVFNYKKGPSYRCLFPDQPSAESIPTCSQIGVMGVLPGIIGTMQANEVIKVILEREDTLSGRFLTIDILSNNFLELKINRVEKNFEIESLGSYESSNELENENSISVDELAEAYQEYFILDIRDKQEREICLLEDSKHIFEEEISNRISEIPRDKKIVIYCHYGRKSKNVVDILIKEYGFSQVFNLSGGIHEWSQEIDNSVVIY